MQLKNNKAVIDLETGKHSRILILRGDFQPESGIGWVTELLRAPASCLLPTASCHGFYGVAFALALALRSFSVFSATMS
jgi:hypothetical protein